MRHCPGSGRAHSPNGRGRSRARGRQIIYMEHQMPKTLIRLFGCAAALAAFSVPLALSAQTVPAAAAPARDGSHDMDFAQGNWRTDITRIKNPFDPNSAVVHSQGTKKVTPIWGGKGWLE
jgi:capsular polysaccharide biosynthesis protein